MRSAAVKTAHELRAAGEPQSCINLSWSEEVPVEPAPGTLLRDISLDSARSFLDLPRKLSPDQAALDAEVAELTLAGSVATFDQCVRNACGVPRRWAGSNSRR